MIFVTGGTGLVGSHVLLKLVQQSKPVKALKRVSSSINICKNVFSYYNSDELFKLIDWVDGDITNIPSLDKAMNGCTYVIHCAALVSFNISDIDNMKKVNIEGTSNVINVALASGIKKMGFVSSVATLGRHVDEQMIDEQSYFKHHKSNSNYAISKYYAEQEVWRGSAEGLDVVIVNPSIILGPGDWDKGSSQIFQKIHKGLKFYTEGGSGYIDVLDVAEALVILLFSEIKNERFILNSANLKYRDCFNQIAKALGKKEASIKVTYFLKEIAWRFELIKSIITGKKPLLTKETANSAMRTHQYSSEKVKKAIQFQFTPIQETIYKYASWFIADLK